MNEISLGTPSVLYCPTHICGFSDGLPTYLPKILTKNMWRTTLNFYQFWIVRDLLKLKLGPGLSAL